MPKFEITSWEHLERTKHFYIAAESEEEAWEKWERDEWDDMDSFEKSYDSDYEIFEVDE